MSAPAPRSTCPADGCPRTIADGMFACRRHWFALPATLRSRVWRAYRAGDLDATLACYREAADVWAAR